MCPRQPLMLMQGILWKGTIVCLAWNQSIYTFIHVLPLQSFSFTTISARFSASSVPKSSPVCFVTACLRLSSSPFLIPLPMVWGSMRSQSSQTTYRDSCDVCHKKQPLWVFCLLYYTRVRQIAHQKWCPDIMASFYPVWCFKITRMWPKYLRFNALWKGNMCAASKHCPLADNYLNVNLAWWTK